MNITKVPLPLAALAMLAALLLVACGDGDAELTRAEVEEIVRAELADAPAPEPGLTAADVEEANPQGPGGHAPAGGRTDRE